MQDKMNQNLQCSAQELGYSIALLSSPLQRVSCFGEPLGGHEKPSSGLEHCTRRAGIEGWDVGEQNGKGFLYKFKDLGCLGGSVC